MASKIIKAKIGDTEYSFEIPSDFFKGLVTHEKPHVHKSKPHPSKNDKYCDLCQKQIRKHYHICEDCYNFLRQSFIKRFKQLEEKIQKLEKKHEK